MESNLDILVIDGNPPFEEVANAWHDIYIEYTDIIDPSFSSSINSGIKGEMLISKEMVVSTCVKLLSIRHYPELVEILNQHGFKYKFDPNDKESYIKDLNRVITGSKFWRMESEEKESEINNKKDSRPEYSQFSKALFTLSKFSGFDIDPKNISAFDFATRYRIMVDHLKNKK